MGLRPIAAIVALALAGAVGGLSLASSDGAPGLLRPDDAGVVALGERVYDAECAACHGADLEGEEDWTARGPDGLLPAPPHDETGHTWHHPDALLFAITKYGTEPVVGGGYRSAMMGFEEHLSDDAIVAVLSYIKSTWPAEIRQGRERAPRQTGETPAGHACVGNHQYRYGRTGFEKQYAREGARGGGQNALQGQETGPEPPRCMKEQY